ncbi:MAG: hypothetical protein NC124_02250 [Clostridium sp.]|nr:hypothetical protein [Clostridium sp.]
MDKENFSWGWVIFIVLILWFFIGGSGYNRFGNYGCGDNGCNVVSNCQVERQGLITAAETNFRIIDENRKSTDAISAQLRAQYDAAQGEKLFDLKMNNLAQQNAFNLALSEKNATIERMTLANSLNERFNQIDATLADINCQMLRRAPVYGLQVSCPSEANVNGFGLNARSFSDCGCGCSVRNGLV